MARSRLLLLLMCTAACGDLDSMEYVHDLRMLAMRADPPEQAIDPNVLIAGAPADLTNTQEVTVTALIADPQHAGRNVSYTFVTCAVQDQNSQRCLPTSVDYQVQATGIVQATDGHAEISMTFQPSDRLLVHALQQDTYHGFDGLRFPVQLTIEAGTEQVTGVKLVVYMPPYPGVTSGPNVNPNIQGISVENQPWPTAGFTFSSAAQPKDGWNLSPVFDQNAQQMYQMPSFDGKVLTFTESWMFDFFTTLAAGFAPTTSGGVQIATNLANGTDTKWKPSKTKQTQTGKFYVVVRNGRGGENWVVLPGTWTP